MSEEDKQKLTKHKKNIIHSMSQEKLQELIEKLIERIEKLF